MWDPGSHIRTEHMPVRLRRCLHNVPDTFSDVVLPTFPGRHLEATPVKLFDTKEGSMEQDAGHVRQRGEVPQLRHPPLFHEVTKTIRVHPGRSTHRHADTAFSGVGGDRTPPCPRPEPRHPARGRGNAVNTIPASRLMSTVCFDMARSSAGRRRGSGLPIWITVLKEGRKEGRPSVIQLTVTDGGRTHRAMPRSARLDPPGELHRIPVQEIERRNILPSRSWSDAST